MSVLNTCEYEKGSRIVMKSKGILLLPLLATANATTVFVTYHLSMRVAPESVKVGEEL